MVKMMLWVHLCITLVVAVVFGVLIDVDHGINMANLKCALALKMEDCNTIGVRGLFHNRYLWSLAVLAIVVWTIHLLLDKVLL